jgi:nucleoside-diphosphate-sugar epimerase
MQTILGANGTIGSLLAKELVTFTNNIRLVSRNPKKVNDTDELLSADLSDASQVDKAIQGSKVVYLVIGFDYNINVWREKWPKLIQAVINACKKYRAKLVFFDNVYMYDVKAISHMTENAPMSPPSKKGEVRKEIVEMILKEVKTGQLTALIARSADFYGPNCDKSLFYMLVLSNIKKRKRPNWLVDADKKHSFTYTPDAAKATAILGNTPDAYNQVWHLPTDKKVLTGREYISIFCKEMKIEPRVSIVSSLTIKLLGIFMPFMRELHEMLYQYDRDYIFNSFKFETRFNFKPTTYEEGIKQMIQAEPSKSTTSPVAEKV